MSIPGWRSRIKAHPAAAMFPLLAETAPDELRELADDIKKNGIQQPIVLWSPTQFPGRDPKEKYLLDGRNRLDAIELAFADDPERLAERIDDALYPDPENGARLLGGDVDPWDFVISANAHRRHLTRDKKRQLVADLLKARPERSDRAVAKIATVSHPTVAAARRGLEQAGDVERFTTRTDSAGRQQPATKPPPPPSKEAQIRVLREQQAKAEPAPTTAPSDAGRVQNAILNAYLALKATDNADLQATRRGLNADQIAQALEYIEGSLGRLRKLQASLRGQP
jgi:hypothetical protein